MKVLGINASPRKNANTQTLVETVLQGATEKGADTRLVNLRKLTINGCLGCEWCKKHLGHCVQKDDLTKLLREMTEVDAVVMGTPVYWYHVTAQFKMLVDRLYSFIDLQMNEETGEEALNSVFPSNKAFLFIVSRGDPEPAPMFPHFYDHLNEWLNLIPFSLNAGRYEFFHQYNTWLDRKAAIKDDDLLAEAIAKGHSLAT
jgi:putative NADPH-quinone reductase